MDSLYDDTLARFDLNFLQSSTSNVIGRHDKQRQSILNLKKKIVASSDLLKKYYNQKERLGEIECLLLASKEECREACIEKKEILESYTKLEKDSAKLKAINQQLLKDVDDLKIQVEAMNSHAYQLQTLVKEQETKLGAIKIEKELERSSLKDNEKTLASYEKEHKAFLTDIKCLTDVVIGKKKAIEIKHILKKYRVKKILDDDVDSDSGDVPEFDDSPIGSPIDRIFCMSSKKEALFSLKNKQIYNEAEYYKLKRDKLNDDHDSGTEVVSEDTGRGSSLALSNMNSPENDFTDIIVKDTIEQVDVGTSPMRVEENLLPNIFDSVPVLNKTLDNGCKTPEYFISDIPFSSEIVTIKEKRKLLDACTSPILQIHDVVNKGTSPINFEKSNEIKSVNSNPTTIYSQKQPSSDAITSTKDAGLCQLSLNSVSRGCELEISKKAVEMDLNRHKENDISNDEEVEMILSKMKLHYNLISPLPKSPDVQTHTINKTHGICPEALKVREENKTLKTNVDFLCKEIMLIKSLLVNKDIIENIKHAENDINVFGDGIHTALVENNDGTKDNANLATEIHNICQDSNNGFDTRPITTESDIYPTTLSSGIISQKFKNNVIFEDDVSTEETLKADIDCKNTKDETNNKQSIKHDHTRVSNNDIFRTNRLPFVSRSGKRRKLTKLDRLKKKVIPRSKIPTQIPMRKTTIFRSIVEKCLKNKPLDILNNKVAYDKALKVMAELKSKKTPETKIKKRKMVRRNNIRKISEKSLISVPKNDLVQKSSLSFSTETKESLSNEKVKCLKENNIHISLESTAPFNKNETESKSSEMGNEKLRNATDIDEIMPKTDICDSENMTHGKVTPEKLDYVKQSDMNKEKTPKTTRRRRTDSVSSIVSKRMLRSSNLKKNECKETQIIETRSCVMDYNDLDIFDTPNETIKKENINSSLNLIKTGNYEGDSDTNSSFSKAKKRRIRISSNNSDRPKKFLRSSNSHVNSDKREDLNIRRHEENEINENSHQTGNERLEGSYDQNNQSNSILCKMIGKYGKKVIKTSVSKVSDKIKDTIFEKIDTALSDIVEQPFEEAHKVLDNLIQYLKSLNQKQFISGLMKYLQNPDRKLELYNKVNTQVPMTKKEQIIVYIIKQMNKQCNVLNTVLNNIEFALFCLTKHPEFDMIESLSHIYAVMCRVFNLKNRLKVFMLDAMYCMQFKSVVVVKQCLTTWPHVLPLAHLPHARTPLVSSIVYLLHFWKCDKRGKKRITDVRWLLDKKYLYNFSDWNQNRILEMFSNAIKSIKDDPNEQNMLRIAIIILAKRQGVKWCQKHIINNLLLPTIEDEKTTERVKVFCIKVLGPLFKVYPMNMKVHIEIITNRLHDMLEVENLSHGLREAVFTSLIYMSKHNPSRVTSALLHWNPENVSSEFEALIKAYVQEKPIKAWKHILSKLH